MPDRLKRLRKANRQLRRRVSDSVGLSVEIVLLPVAGVAAYEVALAEEMYLNLGLLLILALMPIVGIPFLMLWRQGSASTSHVVAYCWNSAVLITWRYIGPLVLIAMWYHMARQQGWALGFKVGVDVVVIACLAFADIRAWWQCVRIYLADLLPGCGSCFGFCFGDKLRNGGTAAFADLEAGTGVAVLKRVADNVATPEAPHCLLTGDKVTYSGSGPFDARVVIDGEFHVRVADDGSLQLFDSTDHGRLAALGDSNVGVVPLRSHDRWPDRCGLLTECRDQGPASASTQGTKESAGCFAFMPWRTQRKPYLPGEAHASARTPLMG